MVSFAVFVPVDCERNQWFALRKEESLMKNFMKVCLIAGGVCIPDRRRNYHCGGRHGRQTVGCLLTITAGSAMISPMALPVTSGRGWTISADLSDNFDDSFDELGREFDDIGRSIHDRLDDGVLNESTFSEIYARKLDLEVRRGRAFITYDAPADKIVVSSGEDMARALECLQRRG